MPEPSPSGFFHALAQADPKTGVRVLFLGDVVGSPGRRLLTERLPGLRSSLGLDMIIANGENAAGGIGLTPGTLAELVAAGVDVVTSGNHIWKHKEMHPCLDRHPAVLRPVNYGGQAPGRGLAVFALPCGVKAGVINLLGRTFMEPLDCPFAAADAALAALREGGADIILVDFHAEASSEKRAMLHYLDGQAAAVCGTHTHVQTADAQITPSGTAYITDLGMCGVEADSVIGMNKEAVLRRFTTGLPQRFTPAKGEVSFNGALLELDGASGKALSISLLRGRRADALWLAAPPPL